MDDKCFQYARTLALNYEGIKWNLEKVSNIKPFINKGAYIKHVGRWAGGFFQKKIVARTIHQRPKYFMTQ